MLEPKEKPEEDICVILGVLIEQEQWRRNTGKVYHGNVDSRGGGLSYFDREYKTALHKKGSEDYLYLRADNPELKGTYIPVEKGLIKKLINSAVQNGEGSATFDVSNLTVDTRQTPKEERIIEYQSYEQDSEKYSGRIELHLKVGTNFVQDLLSRELALWSQGQSPTLEFTVKAEGSTQWNKANKNPNFSIF